MHVVDVLLSLGFNLCLTNKLAYMTKKCLLCLSGLVYS